MDQLVQDFKRDFYLSAEESVEYGMIDKVSFYGSDWYPQSSLLQAPARLLLLTLLLQFLLTTSTFTNTTLSPFFPISYR